MRYDEISALEEQLSNATKKRWWIKENDTQPFYTVECTTSGFECKNNCDTDEAVRMFCKGIMYGYLLTQLERLEIDAEKERKANKRKRLNAAFNPWKFCGKDKMRPYFMLVHLTNGVAVATDTHHLIVEKFDYPAELEDKCVNDDMQPSTEEYRYPDFKPVLVKDDEYSEPFTLEHDANWFAVTAKQMKLDAKRDLKPFVKIGGKYFSQDAAEYLAYWLKYHTPVVFLSRKNNGPIQLADEHGNIFLQMPMLGPDDGDENCIVYE